MPLQIPQQQQERWTSVLDVHTCQTCRTLHGQTFPAGSGPSVPLHGGCRCSRVPTGAPAPSPEAIRPRRAVPTVAPMQPVTPPSGMPGTVVGQYGAETLIAPPEPVGGVRVTAGGRQVGALVGGEYVPYQQAGAMGPARPPERERIPELGALRKEARETTERLRTWREQVTETSKAQKGLLDRFKEWTRPEAPGDPRGAVQGMLSREFQESRRAYAKAGWQDPYGGAYAEMQEMGLGARERGGVRPEAWSSWTIRGRLAQLRETVAEGLPEMGPGVRRALSGMGLFYTMRMSRMFMQPGQQAAMGLGEYQMGLQGAGYAAGLPMGAPAGMGGEVLTMQAQMAQQRLQMGQAAWQAWGGLYGMGGRGGEAGAALSAIGGPAAGVGLGAGMFFGAPVGVAAGLGVGMAGAMGYALNIPPEQQALKAAQLQQQGVNLQALGQAGQVGRWLGVSAPPQAAGYGQQIMGGQLAGLSPGGQVAAMQYYVQNQMPGLETMTPEQRAQLLGGYMGMEGITDLGQVNQQLLQAGGQRAQLLGIAPERAFEPWQQLAQQMGYSPTSQMAGKLATVSLQAETVIIDQRGGAGLMEVTRPRSERDIQQELWQMQNVAPLVQTMRGRYGLDVDPMQLAGRLGGEGMGPERYRMQQLLGGNRLLWSDVGRQIGRPDLVTMEEGGLPIFTQEMRGMQDVMTGQQRGYRDWQAGQQWTQMQATQGYTRGMWGLEDRQRGLQYAQADWTYGFQQQQFGVAGRQWYEQYQQGGQQWQESWQLGQQMFETRVGYQAQDISQQRQRAGQQYQWRMEDFAYSENVAQLQYGWRMEDLDESIRFATGREKRQLMKQQERTTISESMRREHSEEQKERMEEQRRWEEEDFERAKQRNEELVSLQREQFEMQKRHWEENRELALRHHEEDRQMQQEQMEKQREFYLQGRELDEERIQRQREHWELQQKWAEEAWKRAQEYNKEMDKLQDQYKHLQRQQEDVIANFQRMMTYTEELSSAFSSWFAQTSMSTQEYREWHETQRGHQTGGYIEQDEVARLHGGEYVVPRSGQLIIRGEDKESVGLLGETVALLKVIAQAVQDDKVVIVSTGSPERAREHMLDIGDYSHALLP